MHHRRTFLVLLVAVLTAVTACSSSASDESAGSSTTAKPTSTTAAPKAPTPGKPLARYADYETQNYADPGHWLCRPDKDDVCDSDLDATVVEADGTLTPEPFERSTDPPIDCFYVYPTISRDPSQYSDWNASDQEEGYAVLNQAARLQSECRLFAPVYRQLTLTALAQRFDEDDDDATASEEERADPYADVLDAFRTYMANDNDGRGVVLIGHSQGTGMLAKLIAEEIDPNEDVRGALVGAYLAGGGIAVPEGEVVGGLFDNVPLCQQDGETGCVTTWSTYRSTEPPGDDALFGKPRTGGGQAGCVNPAAPEGGSAPLDAYFPSDAKASILSSLGTTTEGSRWLEDDAEGDIATPYVRVPDLVSGECASANGANYLEVTVNPDPDGPRLDDIPGDLSPQWGLHLVDLNVVMGDVVANVAAQADAYGD